MGASLVNCTNATPIPRPVSGNASRSASRAGCRSRICSENGLEYSGAEGAQHLRDKLAKAGDRVKTTEDFITGIASKSFLSGKPYLVKFADGHTQPTGEWLRAHLAEVRKNKR